MNSSDNEDSDVVADDLLRQEIHIWRVALDNEDGSPYGNEILVTSKHDACEVARLISDQFGNPIRSIKHVAMTHFYDFSEELLSVIKRKVLALNVE